MENQKEAPLNWSEQDVIDSRDGRNITFDRQVKLMGENIIKIGEDSE